MLYNYRARDNAGNAIKGALESDSLTTLRSVLKAQGFYLVDAAKAQEKFDLKSFLVSNRMKTGDLAVFCRQISAMLLAGVTLIRALDILYQQTEKPAIKRCLQSLYEDVQKGDMFSDALRRQTGVFPSLMISMVESGEASGTLDKAMERLSDQFEADNRLQNKIKGAMVYPLVVGSLAVFAAVGIIVFVLPTFVGMFEGSSAELPGPTKFIMFLSNVMRNQWFIVLPVIIGIVVGISVFFRSESGMLLKDRIKLKFPIVKATSIKVYAARFSRAMSNLLVSGIPLLTALDITARVVNNSVILKKIDTMREDVRTGVSLATSLKKADAFPPIVYSMVSIGEESGNISDLFDKLSEYLDEEVNSSISKLMSMLEPILMVLVAAVVGFIVISMLLPIFSLYEVIN